MFLRNRKQNETKGDINKQDKPNDHYVHKTSINGGFRIKYRSNTYEWVHNILSSNFGEIQIKNILAENGIEILIERINDAYDCLFSTLKKGVPTTYLPAHAIRGEYDQDGNLRYYFDKDDEKYQAMSTENDMGVGIEFSPNYYSISEILEVIKFLETKLNEQIEEYLQQLELLQEEDK